MARIRNYTDFFKEEKEIYVQNVTGQHQVSVMFQISPGVTESYLFVKSPDPVNITQKIPFAAIKSSMDFRRMLERRPPALQLLTEEEFKAYYANKARSMNRLPKTAEVTQEAIDGAIDHAMTNQEAIRNHIPLKDAPEPKPIHEVVSDGTRFGERKIVKPLDGGISADDIIHPTVQHLCLQVSHNVLDAEKMPASQLLSELENLAPLLKIDDFEYIRAHGWYQTVRNWAKEQIRQKAEEEANASASAQDAGDDLPGEPAVAKPPPAKAQAKKPAQKAART